MTSIQTERRSEAHERATEVPLRKAPVSLPPVIILNMFHSGLAIARDLRNSGIRVLGLTANKLSPGSYTRLCEIRVAPDSQNEPEKLFEYLLSIAAEFKGAVIFPTRDGDVAFLDQYRDTLSTHFHLPIPSQECLNKVVAKDTLAEIAESVGVPVPRTMTVRGPEDVASVSERVGFPCVVKPISALDWRKGGNWNEVGCRKAFLVASVDEFRSEYAKIGQVTPEVLVQEWIPGNTSKIGILGGYVGEDAELLAFFTARKLVQSPDDFGTGCIVKSEPIDGLFELSARVFKAVGYRGLAEVEFKWDDRDNLYKLIEINTRHWDQHELSSASGINLSRIAYQDAIGDPPKLTYVATRPAKWIAEDALILHTLHALAHRQLRLSEFMDSIRGEKIYGLFSWRDPRPFLCSMVQMGRYLMKQSIGFVRKVN